MEKLSPLKAIRAFCLACMGGHAKSYADVATCENLKCSLYHCRMGKTSPECIQRVRAIRLHCLECSGTAMEVRTCSHKPCQFHRFRMGTNPERQGIGNKDAFKRSAHDMVNGEKLNENAKDGS